MMQDRRLETLARADLLILRTLTDLLVHVRDGRWEREHFTARAIEIATETDNLEKLINDGFFLQGIKL